MHSQLGSIIFEGLRGFSTLSESRETNYAEHALIENKPKLQRVGNNLINVEGVMLFDVSFCDPQTEINNLEAARDIGEILPLIMGDGRFVGEFVIKSLKIDTLNTAGNGRLLQAEVSIALLEYWDADRDVSTQSSAIAQAFANPINDPATFVPDVTVPYSEVAQAAASVTESNAAAMTAGSTLQQIHFVQEQYRPKADATIQKMLTVGDSVADVLAVINADPLSELYAVTRQLANNIIVMELLANDVITECQALISDIDTGNNAAIPDRIVTLVNKGTEVKTRASQLMASASSMTALFITQ